MLMCALGASASAWAANPFTIRDIRVEGLERTEPATVFNYLPVQIGDTFTDATGERIIKSLFATGFFNNIQVETKGDVVLLTVQERPVINKVEIKGASVLPGDAIRKNLELMGITEARVYDPAVLNNAVESLKAEYLKKGKMNVKIDPVITKLERNRIALSINIDEGDTTVVKNISFEGNKHFSDSTLRNQMEISETGMFSWITNDDRFFDEKFAEDQKRIIEYYQNHGYAAARIVSANVAPAKDNDKHLNIDITVDEGPRFRMGDIVVLGENKDIPMDELTKLVTSKKGSWYDQSAVKDIMEKIKEKMGEYGYAQAEVQVMPKLDEQNEQIDFVFNLLPNNKTYVRQINITGNNKTRDEVIRREFRQMESAPFDIKKIRRSKERLELLGFFDSINIEPVPVMGAPDQMDLNVSVVERRTGSLDLSVGYVQDDGFVMAGGFSQDNLFGTGKSVNARISNSTSAKVASLSFTDPYFTKDNVSLGYDVFWRTYDPNRIDLTSYKSRTYGAGVRLGVPVTEYDRVNFGLGVNNLKITLFDQSPQRYRDFVNKYGDENWTITGNIGWGRNTTDSHLWPTRGYIINANLESGLPGGDIQYFKLTHSQDWFFPLSKNFTLRIGGKVGIADGYGKMDELPFFHNFYDGGLGFVRGYEGSSLGPKIYNQFGDVDYLGGTKEAAATAELLFPMPGLKNQRSVRLSVFADAGSVWDDKTYKMSDYKTPYYTEDHESTFKNELRYSAGVAFTWLSPIGAIKLSYAVPIKDKQGDKIRKFQFQLGTVF